MSGFGKKEVQILNVGFVTPKATSLCGATSLDIFCVKIHTGVLPMDTMLQQQTTIILWPFVQNYPVERVQKKHSPTHHPDHHPIFSSFFHLLRSIASSLFKLRAWQPLSTSSLVYLLVWSPPPHIPYISSPNQCLLFATHAHTIATCFAVVLRLHCVQKKHPLVFSFITSRQINQYAQKFKHL